MYKVQDPFENHPGATRRFDLTPLKVGVLRYPYPTYLLPTPPDRQAVDLCLRFATVRRVRHP
jgi:hypothetical protein